MAPLSNAQRQKRWRDKRNALAKKAVKMLDDPGASAEALAELRNGKPEAGDRSKPLMPEPGASNRTSRSGCRNGKAWASRCGKP